MKQSKTPHVTTLYIKDRPLYERTLAELKILWMQKFGENLSEAEVIIKSMAFTKNFLLGEFDSTANHTTPKYGRLS